jgi:hypothetical protein
LVTNLFAQYDFNIVSPLADMFTKKIRYNIDTLIQSMEFFVPKIHSDKLMTRCYSFMSDTFKIPLSNEDILMNKEMHHPIFWNLWSAPTDMNTKEILFSLSGNISSCQLSWIMRFKLNLAVCL